MRRVSDTLRAGDRAPEFALEDADGMPRTLQDLLEVGGTGGAHARGTLLLVFDRGTW